MKSLFTQQFSNTNLLVGPLLKVKQAYYYLLFSLKSDMWTEIIRGHIFLNIFPNIDRVVNSSKYTVYLVFDAQS